MVNSADPDQLASEEANWSGYTLFAKQGISGFSKTRVNSFRAKCQTTFVDYFPFFFFFFWQTIGRKEVYM